MADANAVRAGKAEVEVGANTSPLAAALAKAQAELMSFGSGALALGARLGTVGAAAVAALGAASYVFAERGTHLLHQADMVGASVEFMSSLSTGLEMLGGNADSAGQAMFRFNSKLAEAIGGSAQAQRAFLQLGINAADLNNMTTDDRMDRISVAFGNLESHAERSRVAMQLFGRGGREMIEALSQPGGLAAMRAELEKLGLVVGAETAQDALELHKSFTLLKASGESLMNAVLQPMAPIFSAIAGSLAAGARSFRDWSKEHLQWLDSVRDAVSGGDLGLAWSIVMAQMKIAWFDLTQAIMDRIPGLIDAWKGFSDRLTGSFKEAMEFADSFLNTVTLGLSELAKAKVVDAFTPPAGGPQQSAPDWGAIGKRLDERKQLEERLDALKNRAAAIAVRPPLHQLEPDEILSSSFASRGTFNAGAASGLAGAGENPVVSAIRTAAREQREADKRLLDAVLAAGATFA